MYKNLCIFSYNSRGFNKAKQDYLTALTAVAGDCLPVICNQENFLLKSNEYFAKNALPDYHIIFNPATMDDLNGRPKNIMFLAVPDTVKEVIKDVSQPSKRMQSLLFSFESCRMLLINTYFQWILRKTISTTQNSAFFYHKYEAPSQITTSIS